MSVLVTGGTGFIGAPTVRRLVERGEQVVSFDLVPDHAALDRVLGAEHAASVTVVRGDVRDLAHLGRVVREHDVERIVHLASLLVPESQANPMLALEVNCVGTLNMFETARIHGLAKVAWASSMAVFGYLDEERHAVRITEATPLTPDHVYASCKAFAEHLAPDYAEQGVDSLGLRVNLAYGVGKVRGQGMFTHDLIERPVLEGRTVVPYGDDIFDWQYVDDVALAFELAAYAAPADLSVMNLCCTTHSVREAVSVMERLVPEAEFAIEPGRIGFPSNVDGSAFVELTGFAPRWTLEAGLGQVVAAVRQSRQVAR